MKNIVNVVRWVGSGRTATAATVQTVLVAAVFSLYPNPRLASRFALQPQTLP